MIIKIKKKGQKIDAKMARKALNFFADKLMTKRMANSITVNVVFVDGLKKRYKSLGSCCQIDETLTRPKEFEIELDSNLTFRNSIKTLAHEMVHVKQLATGQMKEYVNNNNTRWGDKVYENTEPNNIRYWFYPWEIEAFGMEVGLDVLFRRQLKIEKEMAKKRLKGK